MMFYLNKLSEKYIFRWQPTLKYLDDSDMSYSTV